MLAQQRLHTATVVVLHHNIRKGSVKEYPFNADDVRVGATGDNVHLPLKVSSGLLHINGDLLNRDMIPSSNGVVDLTVNRRR